MSGPKRVVVEYEDGTRRDVSFGMLSRRTQMELTKMGAVEEPRSNKFLLLEWKDGWKEVTAVDGRATELVRYYTLERVEEVGRLSLEVTDNYPELLLIKRLPARVQSIMLVGNDSVKAYTPEEKVTVKEGDKVEHIFYDKKRAGFSSADPSAASERFAALLSLLDEELKKKGLRGAAVLAMSDAERQQFYDDLAHAAGLRGNTQQRDVHEFLQLAIEKLDTMS